VIVSYFLRNTYSGYEEITSTYCIYRQVTPNIFKPQNSMLLQHIAD
jgi:hypothetical protein